MSQQSRYPYKRAGGRSRITAQDWSELSNQVIGSSMQSSTVGLAITRTSGGSNLTLMDPLRTRWCFVVNVTEDGHIIARETVRTPGGNWRTPPGDDILVGFPAPNYTPEHFEHFVIEGSQPLDTDRACLYIGGFFVPDFRMLLVEPVDVDQLCEPCGTQAQADRGLAVGTAEAAALAAIQADCPGCGGGI